MPAKKLRYKRTGLIARRSIILGGLSGIVTLASPAVLRAQTDTFRFGLTPVFLSNDLELLRNVQLYLSAKLNAPVELVTRRTYQEITALLVSGQIHSAWICGYPFVQFRTRSRSRRDTDLAEANRCTNPTSLQGTIVRWTTGNNCAATSMPTPIRIRTQDTWSRKRY